MHQVENMQNCKHTYCDIETIAPTIFAHGLMQLKLPAVKMASLLLDLSTLDTKLWIFAKFSRGFA
uniref:Uncharacterized protein n=1 Tax=Romanomermis culicivorax TaxID=13658 RepID=A0A915L5G7_ROMCU